MSDYAEPIARLIDEFRHFPGIGKMSAQRMAYFVLRLEKEKVEQLCRAISDVKEKIRTCSRCNNFSDSDPCRYCGPSRFAETICVVEKPTDILAIENTREYRGQYHVLHGALSPINGVGPSDIMIGNLLERLREGTVKEIIIATNPNTEGEATASYLSMLIKPIGVKVSRIAFGLPVGSDLEYAGDETMSKALQYRHEM